ncbi:hypothetical protein U1Q18_052180 [Sarracenia purpurea var. burkii]
MNIQTIKGYNSTSVRSIHDGSSLWTHIQSSRHAHILSTGKMHNAKAVVVGASRGIGLEIARKLHAQYPGKAEVVATMRKPDASLLPPEDILIINAAVGRPDEMLDTDAEKLRWYLESNVVAFMKRSVRCFQPLRKGTEKKIVFLSSSSASLRLQIGSKVGLQGPYVEFKVVELSIRVLIRCYCLQSVSKAAANMLAIQFYNELSDERFTVALVHPGWVATDMGQHRRRRRHAGGNECQGIIEQIKISSFEKSPWFVKYNGEDMPW